MKKFTTLLFLLFAGLFSFAQTAEQEPNNSFNSANYISKVITILTYCCKQKKQDKRSTDFFAVKTRPFYWCLMSPRKSMVSVAHDCVIGDVIYLQSRLRD